MTVISFSLPVLVTNVWEDFAMNASIFSFTQTFNFGFNPPHLRVPFQCVMGCAWLGILSFYRSGGKDDSSTDGKVRDSDEASFVKHTVAGSI